MKENGNRISRRTFVRLGAGAGVASGMALTAAGEEGISKTAEMKSRALGKTDLKVSEVGFGTYGFSNSELLEKAIDQGINLVCTASVYQNGRAEEAIGQVMKKRRKDVVLMTGWMCDAKTTKKEMLDSLDASLKRLQTDHVDIIKSHFVEDPACLDNPALYEAFAEAKQAGKAGCLGLSCHGGQLEKVLDKALSKNAFHVIQCKYNFMEYPAQMKLFEAAAKQGVGVVVFKVEAGKRQDEIDGLEKKGLTLRQAATRWALSNPNVASVCAGITNFNQIDELREGVAKKLSRADLEVLEKYAQAVDRSYCRYCSTCESHCPYGVSVADIMRYSMYFKYYRMEKEAMTLFAALPSERRPASCADCPGFCEKGCSHGRAVRAGLLEAGRWLA